ncbi:MAG: DUF2267 domain-containing protein [Cyclobacteriaceae bacterium]
MALDFNKFAAKGNQFMKELSKELGCPDDLSKAGRILKAVLHALRNHLTMEESVQLLAQLPMFLKAVYVENWSLKKHKKVKHLKDFYQEIRDIEPRTADADFPTFDDTSSKVTVVFLILRKFISLGELEDMKSILPKELKGIFNSPVMP